MTAPSFLPEVSLIRPDESRLACINRTIPEQLVLDLVEEWATPPDESFFGLPEPVV